MTLTAMTSVMPFKEISRRLIRCIRKSDTLARIGGDEFILLLGDVTSEEALLLRK